MFKKNHFINIVLVKKGDESREGNSRPIEIKWPNWIRNRCIYQSKCPVVVVLLFKPV